MVPTPPRHARSGSPLDLPDTARATLAREVGYVRKPHGGRLRVALAFPNTYFVGMSNLGLQTVYRLFNADERVVCERVFLPAKQDLAALATRRSPLVTIESQTPVADFDVFAFSVSKALVGYERIQEVLGIESLVRDAPGARRAPKFTGRIELDHVSFHYDADRPII